MKKNIKIACLPVAGIGNPYQYLMIKGLNSESNLQAVSGINDRFFGILRTAIQLKPDYIHFDWITSFYYRRSIWMTSLSIPLFMIQLLIVKYVFNVKLVDLFKLLSFGIIENSNTIYSNALIGLINILPLS